MYRSLESENGFICVLPYLAVLVQYQRVTNRWTDEQIHTTTAYAALA